MKHNNPIRTGVQHFFMLMALTLLGIQSYGQGSRVLASERTGIIKASLLSPFVGTVNLHYESKMNDNSSFQFEAFYFGGQIFGQSIDVNGIGLTANYRFYLTRRFPSGLFIQPFLRYQRYWPVASLRYNAGNAQSTSLGVVLGYQFVLAQRITFDVYGGPYYSRLFLNDQMIRRGYIPVFNGPWVRFGVTMGFLF